MRMTNWSIMYIHQYAYHSEQFEHRMHSGSWDLCVRERCLTACMQHATLSFIFSLSTHRAPYSGSVSNRYSLPWNYSAFWHPNHVRTLYLSSPLMTGTFLLEEPSISQDTTAHSPFLSRDTKNTVSSKKVSIQYNVCPFALNVTMNLSFDNEICMINYNLWLVYSVSYCKPAIHSGNYCCIQS